MLFGQYLQQLRKEAGLTQRDLAAASEIDAAYLSRIENSIEDFYPRETLIRTFITALGVVQDTKKCDSLYLLANRIPPDIKQIIMRKPDVLQMIRKHKKNGTRGQKK